MKKFAVIFKTHRELPVPKKYIEINQKLQSLVKESKGFVDIDSVGDSEGKGISISYWESLEDIKKWKNQAFHLEAQALGAKEFYKYYQVQICEILKEYDGGYDNNQRIHVASKISK